MKMLFFLALLGGGGYYAYQYVYKADPPAVIAYKHFAAAIAADQYDAAMTMSMGDANALMQTYKSERTISRGQAGAPGLMGKMSDGGKEMLREARGTSDGTTYRNITKVITGDEATVDAIQTDHRSSAMGGSPRVIEAKHHATLKLVGGEWKVMTFSEQPL